MNSSSKSSSKSSSMKGMHEIARRFIGVTDLVAREVLPYSGKNDRHLADHHAVEVMRDALNNLPYRTEILIGEGEKDEAPMLYAGEKLGMPVETTETFCAVVDPLECTTNFARGLPDSMSVLMVARKGTIVPVPGTYMEQMLLPKELEDMSGISLDMKPAELLPIVAGALDLHVSEITVVVQDRPRHQELIEQIRELGAGVALIESGSISAAAEIIRRKEGRFTMMWGTFGAPEGLIISFMAKASGFQFLGRVQPHNEKTEMEAEKYGILGRTLSQDEWVEQDALLIISGIHSSVWLDGVRRVKIRNPKNRMLDMDVQRWRHLVSTVVWTMNSVEIVEQENGDLRSSRPFFA